MGNYDHLLSPLMVGNHLFKNRICMTPTTPQWIQSDEPYPAETIIEYYLRRAKNGAALVTLSGLFPFNDTDNPMPPHMKGKFRFFIDRNENHYLSQLCEGMHGFGSFVTIQAQHAIPADWDISAGAQVYERFEDRVPAKHEITPYEMKAATEKLVETCLKLKEIGLDGVFLHMSYQQTPLGRSLSPLINKRTDEYGGSFENRIRFAQETCQAIKDACGKDFIIEAHITGEERDANDEYIPGGWSMEESVRFAEAMSGLIDILHLRGWSLSYQHPMWLGKNEPPYLFLAEACKNAVTETKILTTAGHQYPDKMDEVIASGKADLVGVARAMIADPDFIQKLYRNRADDIVPCIRCNRCFDSGPAGTPQTCRCSVNPIRGWDARVPALFPPSTEKLRVAVAGGGPTGMQAALTAFKRGHEVALYEKADELGGQLNIAKYSERKWNLKNLRNYLIHQMEKNDIELHIGEELTPEVIEREGYDVVLAALGSTPKIPDVKGLDMAKAYTILDVYGREEELGQKVVIIGGGASAIETGMHLAEEFGRDVTVLGRNAMIAKDLSETLCRNVEQAAWEAIENLHPITQATVTAITDEGVVYVDAEGVEHAVEADSVVVGVGMKPNAEKVIDLHGHGARIIAVGDGRIAGTSMDAMFEGYVAASQL